MEYVVLARSCRPQKFSEVLGQDHVIKTLRNAVRLGRTAHAYLFSGPRGTGKTTVARILAKSINCPDRITEEPCCLCSSCREIRDGNSIDVREIDGASNRGIDEIRELKENIRFAPVSSRYKVYIIDEVHMLTKEAFNALLKTLEEPPPQVIFIFATTEIHRVPATILSRCQHFDFRRISINQIRENLTAIAEKEGISISDRGIAWIARGGEGSLRDAQSLFDQVISYAGTDIADDDIEGILGITDRRYAARLSRDVLERKAGECIQIIGELYYAGEDIRQFYRTFTGYIMGVLVAGISNDAELLSEFAEDEQEELRRQAKMVSMKTAERLLDMLLAGEEDMRRTTDPRIQFEYLLVKMAGLEPIVPIDEMVNRLESLEERLKSGRASRQHSPGKGESRPSADMAGTERDDGTTPPLLDPGEQYRGKEPPVQVDSSDHWSRFRELLKAENPILFSKLSAAEYLGTDQGVMKIGVPRGFVFLENLREKESITLMNRLASACEDGKLEVRIEETDMNDKGNGSANGKPSIDDIKSEALRHPLVQKVMDVFEGAEVRDVKVPNGNK